MSDDAWAEVNRLRGAILAHRNAILAHNRLGAGVECDPADRNLWRTIYSEDGHKDE